MRRTREDREQPRATGRRLAIGAATAVAALMLFLLVVPAGPGAAADRLRCKGKAATITEDNRGNPIDNDRDYISGTRRADVIVSLGGNDEIYSGGGNDLICTGGGNDYVFSDSGDDRIYGGDGIDYLVAYTGNDDIYGGDGDDWSPGVQNKKPGRNGRLVGANGDDRIFGGDGRDLLRGNSGDDEMYGEEGDDDLDGGGDTDLCSGGKDFDRGSECERLSGIDDPGWTPSGRLSP
jgi:Ca2+-binding RTX toxin-like protein